jgi:phage terminase large subunit-like protein
MAMTARRVHKELLGSDRPRVAPPIPARSLVDDFRSTAEEMGIALLPWQITAGRYLNAGTEDRWLYREFAGIVARQNGKTEILKPTIVMRLRKGRRMMHTAQNRVLPREVFDAVADYFMAHGRGELKSKPRYANGQEEIVLRNGGRYRIVAPTRGGARGPSNDDVIVDELREMDDFNFIAAAKPTMTASKNPQMIYFSNAGEDDSVVLNAIRARAESDPGLCYLEWSAHPDRSSSDRAGWLEANPSVGHFPQMMEYLEAEYRTASLEGTLAIFETEHLCRWVTTTRTKLIEGSDWTACAGPLGTPSLPVLAVSLDPDRKRASAALAWRMADGSIALRLLYHVTGDPIDTDRLGEDLRKDATRLGVRHVGYDPQTDQLLAKFFKKPESISGQKFANASAQFVNLVVAGKLRWADCDAVTDDLIWTARKTDRESQSYEAVRSSDNHPITASLAAIRAVWLASEPPLPKPKVM